MDSSKLTRVTGWQPRIAFADGIRQTVEWYRTHESWWRTIKNGEFRQYYERMYRKRLELSGTGA